MRGRDWTLTEGKRYSGPGNPTHGIASTYRSSKYRCRCSPCREANTASQRSMDENRAARLSEKADLQHGLVSTYVNWGCRCDECRSAQSETLREQRISRRERLIADPSIRPHGLSATYNGWGCRCEACCTAAAADAKKRQSK